MGRPGFALVAVVVLAICQTMLSGCGGGGSHASVSLISATGRVTLPTGSALDLTQLKVTSCTGVSAVTSDGGFSVTEPAEGPAKVMLSDASGNPILYGYVDAAGSEGEISAKETAVALLFQSIGATSLPSSTWSDALDLIRDSDEASTLGAVIAERVAANPTALIDGDSEIKSALSAATASLSPTVSSSSSRGVRSSGSTRSVFTVTRSSSDPTLVTVSGDNPQSGVTVGANPSGDGIVITNEFRRHLLCFVYRTGYTDSSGTKRETSPWVQISKQYVPATNAVGGVLSSLIDVASGSGAFVQVDSDPIDLPVYPSNAKATYYSIVVVGDGWETSVPDEVASNSLRSKWDDAFDQMQALEWWKEIALPALFTFFPSGIFEGATDADFMKMAVDVVGICSQTGLDITANLASHQYLSATTSLLKAVSGNETLRGRIAACLVKYILKNASQDRVESLLESGGAVNAALAIVDKLISVYDLGAVFRDLNKSAPFTYWEAESDPPTVRLQATPTDVAAGQSSTLLVTMGGQVQSSAYYYKFVFSTPGRNGLIQDADGVKTPATTLTQSSTKPGITARYVADSDAKAGESETVKVVVTRVSTEDGSSVEYGSAEVTLTIADAKVYNAADDFSFSSNPNGVWSYGYAGSLTGTPTLYTTKTTDSLGLSIWYGSTDNYAPNVMKNETGATITSSTHSIMWAAGDLTMHPGRGGTYSVVRWTAPSAGKCSVSATFTLTDVQATNVDAHVVNNGSSLYSAAVSGYGGSGAYSSSSDISVAEGDTIDFVVGYGSGCSFLNDTTRLDGTITFKTGD